MTAQAGSGEEDAAAWPCANTSLQHCCRSARLCASANFLAAAELGRHSGGRGDFSPAHAALPFGLAVVFWFLKAWYAEKPLVSHRAGKWLFAHLIHKPTSVLQQAEARCLFLHKAQHKAQLPVSLRSRHLLLSNTQPLPRARQHVLSSGQCRYRKESETEAAIGF